MGLRTCIVCYCDLKGVEHAVEVTADSLYGAVAQGLRVFRESDWIDEVGRGQTTISVVVREPEVQHKVRVQDFERWLESQGRTPAEGVSKPGYERASKRNCISIKWRRDGRNGRALTPPKCRFTTSFASLVGIARFANCAHFEQSDPD